jgi:AcrR family transcriptional regulator
LRIFAQKGFDRATNKDIAREAGITPGLIYHYFASKQALLQAIIEQGSPVQSVRSISPQLLTEPPEILLRLVLQQMLEIAESKQFLRLVSVFLPELLHNRNPSLVSLDTIHEATQFLTDYLAAKMESGALRQADPALVAQTIMATVTGFVVRRQVMRDPQALQYTHEQIIDSVINTTLNGLR